MSDVSYTPYTPYTINRNIFTDAVASEDLQYADSSVSQTALVYTKQMKEAMSFLTHTGGNSRALTWILDQLSLESALQVVPIKDTASIKNIISYIENVNLGIQRDLQITPEGVDFIRLSGIVWNEKRGQVADLVSRLARVAARPEPDISARDPTPRDYNNIIDVIVAFYNKMRTDIESGASSESLSKYSLINKSDRGKLSLSEELLRNVFYISATHKNIDANNKMLVCDLFNSFIWRVLDTLERVVNIMERKTVDEKKVAMPKYLEMLHSASREDILSLNSNLVRYLKDMGLDSEVAEAKASSVPSFADLNQELSAVSSRESPTAAHIARLNHYASDLYLSYKLIVRDTLLYQFRSSVNRVPDQVARDWRDMTATDHFRKYADYGAFLDELLFYPLKPGFIGDDVTTYNSLKRIIEDNVVPDKDCDIQRALGPKNYIRFLKDAAMDSREGVIQVRTETVLRYLATDIMLPSLARFDNLETSEAYTSAVAILNDVASRIVSMNGIIVSVFNILHAHKNVYLGDKQTVSAEVLTFVKIRNDNPDYGNRRFEIFLDTSATTMMLKYEDLETPCYQKFRDWKAKYRTALVNKTRPPDHPALAYVNAQADAAKRKAAVATKLAKRTALEAERKTSRKSAKAAQSNPGEKNNAGLLAPPVQGRDVSVLMKLDESLKDEAYDPAMAVPRGDRSTFMFGPFTRVYKPLEDAETIARDAVQSQTMNETVLARLRAGQNVCIFGYGQSGSGKTSLLIYFKRRPDDTGDDGIMSLLCNKMGNDFGEIECQIREIGVLNPGDGADNPSIIGGQRPIKKDLIEKFYSSKTFRYNGQEWLMDPDDFDNLPNNQLPRVASLPEMEFIRQDVLRRLASYVFFTTENCRLTEATTNNPTSSRSHVFVFLRFRKPKRVGVTEPTLVIGDFAGVENRFACDQPSVLKAFSEVKYDNRDEFAYRNLINSTYRANFRLGTPESPLVNGALGTVADLNATDYSEVVVANEAAITAQIEHEAYRDRLVQNVDVLRSMAAGDVVAGKPFIDTLLAKCVREAISMTKIDQKYSSANRYKYSDKFQNTLFDLSPANMGNTNVPPIVERFIQDGPYRATVYNCLFRSRVTPDDVQTMIYNNTAKIVANIQTMMPRVDRKYCGLDMFIYYALKATSQLGMGSECSFRVDEGIYINNSLEMFRRFLSNSLKRRGAVPKILKQCGAIQCNPFYNDCFGSSFDSAGGKIGMVEETLVKMLTTSDRVREDIDSKSGLTDSARYELAVDALKDLTYCVFNVVNISKDRNDPPPTPFIDATPVVFEYNRTTSYPKQHDDAFSTPVGNPGFNVSVLHDLRKRTILHRTLSGTETEGVKGALVKAIDDATAFITTHATPEIYIPKVRAVIDEFEKVNAPTFIGTMIFTDTIAKFGVNRMMCVLESDAYAKGPNNFIDNMVFNNLNRLQTTAQKLLCDNIMRENGACE